MQHPISGEVKELSEAEFLALFDESVHDRIRANAKQPGVEAVVCFECLDMCSSNLGARSALIMGPGCSFPLGDVEKRGCHLGNVPSRFQYPVSLWRIRAPEFFAPTDLGSREPLNSAGRPT